MNAISHREQYRPSGRVGWLRFLPWSVLALAVTVAVGAVLYLAFIHGIYIVVLAPILAGAIAAGMVFLAVRFGHCRNRVFGGSLGFVAGILLYLSYYHTGLVDIVGLKNAHRVDWLPWYIHLRLQNDVVEDVGKPANPQGGKADIFGNGFLLLLELSIVCIFTTAAGIHRAKMPYSEVSGQWMREQHGLFPAGAGNALVLALETKTLVQWVTAGP